MTIGPIMRATVAVLLIPAFAMLVAIADARASTPETSREIAAKQPVTEISSQQRRRPRVRIYREYDDRGVSPSYFPGSNAVRDCSVTYVREFRPSGTVIVPNMKCFWRRP